MLMLPMTYAQGSLGFDRPMRTTHTACVKALICSGLDKQCFRRLLLNTDAFGTAQTDPPLSECIEATHANAAHDLCARFIGL